MIRLFNFSNLNRKLSNVPLSLEQFLNHKCKDKHWKWYLKSQLSLKQTCIDQRKIWNAASLTTTTTKAQNICTFWKDKTLRQSQKPKRNSNHFPINFNSIVDVGEIVSKQDWYVYEILTSIFYGITLIFNPAKWYKNMLFLSGKFFCEQTSLKVRKYLWLRPGIDSTKLHFSSFPIFHCYL